MCAPSTHGRIDFAFGIKYNSIIEYDLQLVAGLCRTLESRPSQNMKNRTVIRLFILLALGLLVIAVATWPLFRHPRSTIPHHPRKPGRPAIVRFEPGDHLQLLYHFWLCRDAIAGHTRAFSNPYEFCFTPNAERRRLLTYYIPFSLVYAAVSPLAGHATGWNLAILASHLLGLLGFYLLAHRFFKSWPVSCALAVAAASFPFKWLTLISGSPTGFAMAFVPWVFYGVDRAVRDESEKGALIAGMALLLANTSDPHTFFFVCLSLPFAMLFSWLSLPERRTYSWRVLCRVWTPFGICAAICVGIGLVSMLGFSSSSVGGERLLDEVALYSPSPKGLLTRSITPFTRSSRIYVGWAFAAAFPCAFACFLASGNWRRNHRLLARFALFTIFCVALLVLAFGTNCPLLGDLPIRLARAMIPGYRMIRQSDKILCLAPALPILLAAASFPEGSGTPASGKRLELVRDVLLVAFAAAIALEQAPHFQPRLCAIPTEWTAYTAVAADAGKSRPKAVCVPVLRGDVTMASFYEWGVMQSRIGLLGGYSAAYDRNYTTMAYKPLRLLDRGVLDDSQIQHLHDLGCTHLILHYSLFRNKANGRHVTRLFKRNPALQLLVDDKRNGIASFSIMYP